MLLMPDSGWTTSTFGAFTSSEIGAKSLIGSYGRFLNSAGLTAIAVEASSRVWPSGVARATCPMPMLPAAPPRLSTTTCWPSDWLSESDRIRAMMSVGPPGANGTTTVMGRSGKAAAGRTRHSSAAAPTAVIATRRNWLRHPVERIRFTPFCDIAAVIL